MSKTLPFLTTLAFYIALAGLIITVINLYLKERKLLKLIFLPPVFALLALLANRFTNIQMADFNKSTIDSLNSKITKLEKPPLPSRIKALLNEVDRKVLKRFRENDTLVVVKEALSLAQYMEYKNIIIKDRINKYIKHIAMYEGMGNKNEEAIVYVVTFKLFPPLYNAIKK